MKPNPISALNQLTVPSATACALRLPFRVCGLAAVDTTIVEFGEDRKFDEYGLVLICRRFRIDIHGMGKRSFKVAGHISGEALTLGVCIGLMCQPGQSRLRSANILSR